MKKIGLLFLLLLCALLTACSPVRVDGPYKGRVVDRQTGEPIQGAVVLGVWDTEMPTPAGATHKYHDAQETVTDKDGNFELKGQGLLLFSTVTPMRVLIFKSGYEYIGSYYWDSLTEKKKIPQQVVWDGDRAVFHVWKLSVKERKSPPDPPSEADFEKIRLLLKEIDKDDIERGLKPRRIWQGKTIE